MSSSRPCPIEQADTYAEGEPESGIFALPPAEDRNLAVALLESLEQPAALLFRSSRIAAVNSRMTGLVGARLIQRAQTWSDLCGSPQDLELWMCNWRVVQEGGIAPFAFRLAGPGMPPRLLRIQPRKLRANSDQFVLLLVDAVEKDAVAGPFFEGDTQYEISIAPESFGRVHRFWPLREDLLEKTGRCFEVVHNRCEPCNPCPARALNGESRRAETRVLARVDKTTISISTAYLVAESRALVKSRELDAKVLGPIFQAKLERMAARRELSEREEEVLQKLVDGLTLNEIAQALRITLRTVKFHQARLLEKLGVESRAELTQTILWD